MFKRLSFLIFLFVLGNPWTSLGFGQNIAIDTSSPFLTSEYSKKISMDFQEAPLDKILKIFSQQTSINFITAESIANKKVTVYLDNVPVEEALEQLLRANNLTYEIQAGSNIYMVKPLQQPGLELLTRVYPLKYATVSNAQIRDTIDIEGVTQTTTGGISDTLKSLLTEKGKLVEDPRTNSLIISDIATNFPKIENALAKLDVPILQILIEAEMLEVTQDVADLIGNKIGDTPLVASGAKKAMFFPFTDQGPTYTAGSVDFSGMKATIQFLRTQTGTKTLARPRILTINNQAAEIKVTTDEAVGNIENISGSSSQTETKTSEAERVETGVSLLVTPQANLLTGEITMAIKPKVATVKNTTTITTTDGTTTYYNPEERQTQNILKIRDGDTIIIGGLLRQDITKVVTKVPLLGDIPFIGAAFRHTNNKVTDKELLIFITPHIINSENSDPKTVANIRRLDREQDAPDAAQAAAPDLTVQK